MGGRVAIAPATCGVFFLWPVVSLLALSLGGDTGPTDHYARIVEVAVYRRGLVTTFGIA